MEHLSQGPGTSGSSPPSHSRPHPTYTVLMLYSFRDREGRGPWRIASVHWLRRLMTSFLGGDFYPWWVREWCLSPRAVHTLARHASWSRGTLLLLAGYSQGEDTVKLSWLPKVTLASCVQLSSLSHAGNEHFLCSEHRSVPLTFHS